MKSLEEFTITSVAFYVEKELARFIIKALEPKLVGTQLLAIDKTLVGVKSNTRTYQRTTPVNASEFAENADIPLITPTTTFTAIDVTPTYFGCAEVITGQAIATADFPLINHIKELLADAMARMSDSRIWEAILDSETVTPAPISVAPGTHDIDLPGLPKVLEMVSYTPGPPDIVLEGVDYFRGRVRVTNTTGAAIDVTFTYITTTRNAVNANTVKELAYVDLVNARATIVGLYGRPDTLVVGAGGESWLLKDDKFLDASAFGERVVMNGQIGRAAGMDVLVSQTMHPYVGVLLQKGQSLGYLCIKEPLTVKVRDLLDRPGDIRINVWEKSKPGIVNPDLVCVILNAQPDALNIP